MTRTVAALYILANGPYSDLPGVDPWPEDRDARTYAGPHPVVAHPPCKRWGRYWFGGPSAKLRLHMGDDGGCFDAALASVRRWGGVLEHPEASHAWPHHGLTKPPKTGWWTPAGLGDPGWTCCVEQGHYGHRSRKATWLYAVGIDLPRLVWGKASGLERIDAGCHTAEERARRRRSGSLIESTVSMRARMLTPEPFRDLLLAMARTVEDPAPS